MTDHDMRAALIDHTRRLDATLAFMDEIRTMTDASVTVTHDEVDGGWIAEYRDIPGCMSQGDSREEAVANLADAVLESVAVRRD